MTESTTTDIHEYRDWILKVLESLDEKTNILLENGQHLNTEVQLNRQRYLDLERNVTKNIEKTEKISEKIETIERETHVLKMKLDTRHEGYSWLATVAMGISMAILGAIFAFVFKNN